MSPLRRFLSLATISLGSALLAACVPSPDDAAQLNAGQSLSQRSEHGLVEAVVSLSSPEISRGPNDFSITLRPLEGSLSPVLTSVDASMAAHGHRASTSAIERDGQTFRVLDLDLFMSGVWQVSLGVEQGESADLVQFSLDVP